MEFFDTFEIWLEQPFVSKYISCIVYLFLAVSLVLPFVIGLIAISFTLFLSLTIPPAPSAINDSAVDKTKVVSPQIGTAVIVASVSEERRNYYLHSLSGYYNVGNLYIRDLKTMLSNYIMPCNTPEVQHILMLTTPQHLHSQLKAGNNNYHFQLDKAHPCPTPSGSYSHKRTPDLKHCHDGLLPQDDDFSAGRLKYLDFSPKSWVSSQSFCKEKRPLHFKFLSNP